MGLFRYIRVVEPHCEINTLWKWITNTTVAFEAYPCVGLFYWLNFSFMADMDPYGRVGSTLSPAVFGLMFICTLILCYYIQTIKVDH
jgi:hypothetical protein